MTEYTLCCLGGAGGQHACLVADALGMTRIVIHPLAGVLSAYGMGLADVTVMREQSVEVELAQASARLIEDALEALASEARSELLRQGLADERIRMIRRVHLRYDGTDSALIVDLGTVREMVERFETAYQRRYSFLMPGRGLIAEAVSVEAVGASDAPMTDEQLKAAPGKLLHIPTVMGAVAVIYNLPGAETINLSGDLLAEIYLGKVKKW